MFIKTSKNEITFDKGGKWLSGNVIEKTGPLSYIIASNNGTTRGHIDQLRPRAIIRATYNCPDLITIITLSIKETHTLVPTDDESRIHPLLNRTSSRDSIQDQTDLLADLGNAENQPPRVTRPRQDRKPHKYLEDLER